MALIHFANTLLKDNEIQFVKDYLYGGSLNPNTMSVIKIDLEYTAHHWHEKSYDLWEEIYGDHFFTTMAQRKALVAGAKLARQLHDENAAIFYEYEADLIKEQLQHHINSNLPLIQSTLPPYPGPQKTNNLDSSIILASMIGDIENDVFPPDNFYIKKTARALKAIFKKEIPGTSLTATMAEYYYTLASRIDRQELKDAYIQ